MISYQELFSFGEDFESFVSRGMSAEIAAVRHFQGKLGEPGAISQSSLERLTSVTRRFHLLIAGEMWCPDCQINVSAMDFLHRIQPNIDLAIITKGRAENELKQRLELDRISIPFVLVLDDQFQPIGRFVERPLKVIGAGDDVKPHYRAGEYLGSTVEDFLDIFEAASPDS